MEKDLLSDGHRGGPLTEKPIFTYQCLDSTMEFARSIGWDKFPETDPEYLDGCGYLDTDKALDEAFTFIRSRGYRFAWDDSLNPDRQKDIRIKVNAKPYPSAEIFIKGMSLCGSVGDDSPIYLEYYEGKWWLRVWADINQEDTTHSIDMSGALEINRE